jgi:hypothetical protein
MPETYLVGSAQPTHSIFSYFLILGELLHNYPVGVPLVGTQG